MTDVHTIITVRNSMLKEQQRLYLSAVANVNMRCRELLKNDFGSTLVKNCAWDAADLIVSNYFHMQDYYISPQQLYNRIVYFSYENEIDPLLEDSTIKKLAYAGDTCADVVRDLAAQSEQAGNYLFQENRKGNKSERLTKDYRENREKAGALTDDITGKEGSASIVYKNGKEVLVSNLHADHIQARDSIKYDSRYIDEKRLDDMKSFFYSKNNFWLINASANTSKGAVRVCKTDRGIEFLSNAEYKDRLSKNLIGPESDITWKASAEQLADATIVMWEKETASGKKFEALKREGYLDENNQVRSDVKEKLIQAYRKAINEESMRTILPYVEETGDGAKEWKMPWVDYGKVTHGAVEMTEQTMKKIIVGQVIYYVLPPLLFETKKLCKKKNMDLERFYKEIKKSGKRVISYVTSKLGEILKNIVGNTIHNFVKNFFDIIIEMVRETVKRMVKIAKQLMLSLVNCIRIVASKQSSQAQKADAISKTLAVSITMIVVEILFEYAEGKFGIPDQLMEPLQIIVTIISTNLIMLVLQKLDLFDTQYGLLVANIEKIFEQENKRLIAEGQVLLERGKGAMEFQLNSLKRNIDDIEESLNELNLYVDDLETPLNQINEIFNMGIDFDQEWRDYTMPVAKA